MRTWTNYSELLKDPRWQQMRLATFTRDEWKCRACGCSDKTLHAHHTHYRKGVEGPWDYAEEEVITLCEACHGIEHETFDSHAAGLMFSAAFAGFVLGSDFETLGDIISEIGSVIKTGDYTVLQNMIEGVAEKRARKAEK